MKKFVPILVGVMVLVGVCLGVTSCTQTPAPAAAADTSAPAASAPPVVVEQRRTVVVEEQHPRSGVDINVHKRDGDHTSVDIHTRP